MKIVAKRIVFHANSSLGDAIVYIPSLFILRQMYPDAEIVCTANYVAYELYQRLGFINKVIRIFKGDLTCDQTAELFIKEINGYQDEQGNHPCADAVILAERSSFFIKAALRSNCPNIVTFSYFKALFTPRLHFTPYFQRWKTQEVLHYQFLAKQLNPKLYKQALDQADLNQARLSPSKEAQEAINQEFLSLGYQGQKLAIFNPLSANCLKRGFSFDIPTLVNLVNELASEFPQIFFVVSSNNADAIKAEDLHSDNLKLLVNKGGLDKLIALVDRCSLLFAPSTGTAHIADNMGKDVCGIYPYYDYKRWVATGMNQLSQRQKHPSITPNHFTCTFLPKNWKDDPQKYLEDYKQNCRASLQRLISLQLAPSNVLCRQIQ